MAFPEKAPCAYPVFYRTYSRTKNGVRETWEQMCDRALAGLKELGQLTPEEYSLIENELRSHHTYASGRWFWVGGTTWVENPQNVLGAYNCVSIQPDGFEDFGLLADLAMQGCGTGAVLEPFVLDKLPIITRKLSVTTLGKPGDVPASERIDQTISTDPTQDMTIIVGDSREGWVDAYVALLKAATSSPVVTDVLLPVVVVLGHVRPLGEPLQGFGGVANPVELPPLFERVAEITNEAHGRRLDFVEACLVIDEMAKTIVAGNLRRCLPEDALVHTSHGLVPIKDVTVGDMVQTPIGFRRVTNKFDQGVQDVYEIPCNHPVLPRATLNHQMAVVAEGGDLDYGWKTVSTLVQGDLLLYSTYDAYFPEAGVMTNSSVCVLDSPKLHSKIQTYDIEVEEAHCFYCDGYLTHNSAGIRQGGEAAATSKEGLWQQDEQGNWSIDPKRDALRMANHTRVFHHKPTLEEVIAAVRKNYYSGEGAIQYAPEAVARCSPDLVLDRASFFAAYEKSKAAEYLQKSALEQGIELEPGELEHRLRRYGLNPCGEVIGSDFACNLSEVNLNTLDPEDVEAQLRAFKAAAVNICSLLYHKFPYPKMQKSRQWDPIVAACPTGFFDFFVKAFGRSWLEWWQAGRPKDWGKTVLWAPLFSSFSQSTVEEMQLSEFFLTREREYMTLWREVVKETMIEFCDRRGLKRPNRFTSVQPSGCLSRDAIRVFDRGLLLADEHMEDGSGEVDLSEFALTVRGGIPIHSGIANQPKELLRVTLANGRQITMTPDHRLRVQAKWIQAQDLVPGHQIDYRLGTYRNAVDSPLTPVAVQLGLTGRQPVGCLMPEQVSPSLAYFVGAMFGNGSMSDSHYRIRFSHGTLSVLQRISQIASNLFGITGSLTGIKKGKYELCLANKQLYLWFKENQIGKDKKSKELSRIPQKIRTSSRESILAFFAGLIDTDGCIRTNGHLSIDSASEPFMRHLQQVGEAVGLSFSLYVNSKGENLQEQKMMFGLCLGRTLSNPDSLAFLNIHSVKAQSRQISPVKRIQKQAPYEVVSIEPVLDYSFDYEVEGEGDDDSWYYQGALVSHNTKALLTGASPGWHPPKAARFIRRISMRREEPVALACRDYGYNIVPAQSAKDENGKLLDDPMDPRCKEWLVEIPVEVPWASLAEGIDLSQFSALAQFDFYMQVQRYYTTHNCFSRSTRFLTDKGVKSFEDFNEGDTAIVLNADGKWVPATVVTTGNPREMLHIRIHHVKGGKVIAEKTIVSTPCHRFPVQVLYTEETEVKTASELKVGDYLVLNRKGLKKTWLEKVKEFLRLPQFRGDWAVVEILQGVEAEMGWCVMEPKTNHFTLEDGILVMNTSATLELREPEIEPLAKAIHDAMEHGYISAAILARFDDLESFPRLPFEPIDEATYERMCQEVLDRRTEPDFEKALAYYDAQGAIQMVAGPAPCDSGGCLLK